SFHLHTNSGVGRIDALISLLIYLLFSMAQQDLNPLLPSKKCFEFNGFKVDLCYHHPITDHPIR
ncbi:MAG: hypothetical protein WBP88_03795, partial [Nitrososphaeraceae archaeon]